MSIFDLYNTIQELHLNLGQIGGLLVVLSFFVQIAPIPINPWTAISNVFGTWFKSLIVEAVSGELKDIRTDVKQVNNKLDTFRKEEAEIRERDKAISCRRNVLAFADEISREIKHSHEQWSQIIEDVDFYEDYCRENPDFPNGKAVNSISFIKDTYKVISRKNGI